MNLPTSASNRILFLLALALFFSIALSLWLLLSRQNTQKLICGYNTCPESEPKKLNIHLVAHTHNDLGYIKTFNQYYLDGVVHIIHSVIDSLLKDPNRRFIFAETAYLWKWWQHQNEKKRQIMRKLINEGRIEIVGGGWSMNDEATTYYQSVIDQYSWGLRRLDDEFGSCSRPKVGWQIDPFGHSREQASMFAQMGLDGMFIGRLAYQDKWMRLKNKIAEFIWEGSPSLGKSANLFTSILYNRYSPPPGFCFDEDCNERVPIVDDPDDVNYNVDQRAKLLLRFAKKQAMAYKTKNIIFTMGDNLTYKKAELWFSNMDKLIKYINTKLETEYKIFYSTPSCYLKSLNDLNTTWPIKTDDFFPYSNDYQTFWTGFYTSRPTLKFFTRLGNNLLQVVKQLSVLSEQPDSKDLQLYREAEGVLQHHDAITGTEQQHVASDFAKTLYMNMIKGKNLASAAMNNLIQMQPKSEKYEFYSCLRLNISTCDHSSENKKFIVTIFNPTSQPLTTFVRIPVQKYLYSVRDFTGNDIITQMVPIPESVLKIPGRHSSATMELIFRAVNISALGHQSFYVSREKDEFVDFPKDRHTKSIEQALSGEFYNISVDAHGKALVHLIKETKELKFNQSFHYYEAAEGDGTEYSNHSSGAYVFKPKHNYSQEINVTETVQVFKGPLVEEIHQTINSWVSQIIRIYNGNDYIEFDWLVGPVPVEDGIGKEVITRFSSNLKNNGEFYTDSNGREMLKRRLNSRPNYDVWLNEPISSNYYPVTSKIYIEDKKEMLRMSVLPDRGQGGSSLQNGEIELMIHRRLLYDDELGLAEALNEMSYNTGLVVKGQHYLVAGSLMDRDELILLEKEMAYELAVRPWIFFTPMSLSFEEWNNLYWMKMFGLRTSLPRNVRILTLEPWKEGEVLLRLEHFFEVGETRLYSTTAEVDLKALFQFFNVKSAREMTLDANQLLKDSERLKWKAEADEVWQTETANTDRLEVVNRRIIVHLSPMQIRTFILKLKVRTER